MIHNSAPDASGTEPRLILVPSSEAQSLTHLQAWGWRRCQLAPHTRLMQSQGAFSFLSPLSATDYEHGAALPAGLVTMALSPLLLWPQVSPSRSSPQNEPRLQASPGAQCESRKAGATGSVVLREGALPQQNKTRRARGDGQGRSCGSTGKPHARS